MAVAALPSLLTEVETAVGASRPDAVDAAVKAFRAKAPPLELARAAARGVATHYDPASGVAPRSLAILGAASNLTSVMEPRFQVLPVLQAIAYAASERKPAVPAKPPLVVSGEVTHLGRSFLFAVRAGDVAEAESIFLGMVDEDWERKMAGDMLFRAALAAGLVVAAARRLLPAKGYDTAAARRLLFAHASRFVLNFSRTGERLYALFQAALRVRSPEPALKPDVDPRTPVAKLDVIANLACRDSPAANEGYNLLLADACITEYAATKAAPIVLALARMSEASPKDQAAYQSWASLFGP